MVQAYNFFIYIDSKVNIVVQNIISESVWLYDMAHVVSFFGSFVFIFYASIFLCAVLALMYVIKNYDIWYLSSLKFLVTALLLSTLATYFLKIYFERSGPVGRALLEIDYSFPSGHATVAVAFFGAVYFIFRDIFYLEKHRFYFLIFTLFAVFLIGLSRLVLDVHFISDVLVGYFVGFVSLLVANTLHKKW